jgi:hypothetical protein
MSSCAIEDAVLCNYTTSSSAIAATCRAMHITSDCCRSACSGLGLLMMILGCCVTTAGFVLAHSLLMMACYYAQQVC